MEKEAINKRLRKFYEFDDDDLYSNERGMLTQKQKAAMEERGRVIRKAGVGIGIFFLALALCMGALALFILVISVLAGKWEYSTSTGPLIYTTVAFLILGSIGAFVLFTTPRAA